MIAIDGITIIVPCYNEAVEVLLETVADIQKALEASEVDAYEVIIVNDGSSKYTYEGVPTNDIVRLIEHPVNKGYGGALKTGILNAKYDWVGITDADGTYPNARFGDLIKEAKQGYDMVVGARAWNDISALRRVPKWILTQFASFLANYPILDLNSGMRIFRVEMAKQFWKLYPNGFSFTSTITMGCVTNGFQLSYVPIDYFTRIGQSSIHPIKDTYRFFTLVTRLALYFNPLRFFFPISLVLGLLAVARGLRDYFIQQQFGGLTLVLFFMAFQVFFFGLLAEIISKNPRHKMTPTTMDQREQKDRELFDRIAAHYAAKDVYPPSKYARKFLFDSLFDLVESRTGDRPRNLIDIGCGSGAASEHLQGRYDRYIGTDYSKELIEIGKKQYGHLPGVSLYSDNVKDLDLGEFVPDMVMGNGVLHHVDDLPAVMQTLKDLGQSGTYYGFIEPQSGNPIIQGLRAIRKQIDPKYSDDQIFFNKKELRQLFLDHDFEVVEVWHQGYFTTPIAQVMLKPQAIFMPYSRLACWIDRGIQKRVSSRLAWNLLVVARLK